MCVEPMEDSAGVMNHILLVQSVAEPLVFEEVVSQPVVSVPQLLQDSHLNSLPCC